MGKNICRIRYGLLRHTEPFFCEIEGLKPRSCMIIRTSRGVDYGYVVGDPEAVTETVNKLPRILRQASETDLGIIEHLQGQKEPEELKRCQKMIRAMKLPMQLAGVEHLFSGDKLIFYFLAEKRVDFRALVKDLASFYRTRIEMKQIGARDQARLLGDVGDCGQDLCCRTFITEFQPISMRMAKMQKTTLDPSKISGRCGRLKCCLRYEDEVYLEHRSMLPKRGQRIIADDIEGEVIGLNLLKLSAIVRMPDGTREEVPHSQMKPAPKKPSASAKRGQGERSQGERGQDERSRNEGN